MTHRPFLIVSDTHLGAVPADTERAFRRFLQHAGSEASGLLINGDLFDFWFEYRTVVPRQHYRVLAALADVVEGGVPVWFVGGNHDAWGGSFLRDEVGVQVVEGPLEMRLGGRRALVAHGDGVGRGDLGYRLLKSFIRNPATVGAFRLLHPDWGSWIAGRVSTTHEKEQLADPRAAGRARYIREWAEQQLRRDPGLELVVTGHSHLPVVEELQPGRYFVNSGDWIHRRSYVELPADGSAPRLREWTA